MDNLLDLLLQATITLTQGGAIKDRLADAYAAHLIQIDSEDLPEHLRSDFESNPPLASANIAFLAIL